MEKIAIEIVAAFETWHNGGLQMSALYTRSKDGYRLEDFVEGNKGSFATLHTFTSEKEARKEYNDLLDEIYGYQQG